MNESRIPANEKFAKSSRPKPAGKKLQLTGSLPAKDAHVGDETKVYVRARGNGHSRTICLTKKIGQGGEGSVFETDDETLVAKIYDENHLTSDRKAKIELMVKKGLKCEGICFPVDEILNDHDQFIGYLMPKAKGYDLAKSVCIPKLITQKFPGWNRRDLVQLCITILKKFEYLNSRNIIIGDVNASNILVENPRSVYFVDCDSYQVDGYLCPVGTPHFTPPEAQGKNFATFLRTQEMENFSIATLLFMIMLPGKAPYAAVDGGSPSEGIKNGDFPYPHNDAHGENAPKGPWGFVWSHLEFRTREAFFNTFYKTGDHFAPQNRLDAGAWRLIMENYRSALDTYLVKKDEQDLFIFPNRVKKKRCKQCGEMFVPDGNHWSLCPKCAKGKVCRSKPQSIAPSSKVAKRHPGSKRGTAVQQPAPVVSKSKIARYGAPVKKSKPAAQPAAANSAGFLSRLLKIFFDW